MLGLLIPGQHAEPAPALAATVLSVEEAIGVVVCEGERACPHLLEAIGLGEDLMSWLEGGEHREIPVLVGLVALHELHEEVLRLGEVILPVEPALGAEEAHQGAGHPAELLEGRRVAAVENLHVLELGHEDGSRPHHSEQIEGDDGRLQGRQEEA